MNQGLNHAGYPTVSLKHSDGTRKRFIRRVHQLIAETFIKKGSRAKLQVNHKNGIKTDNSASNLEWVTDTQNQTHKCTVLKTHRYGETHHNVKLKESDVIFIRKLFKKGYRTTQISREYGFPYYAVSDIKNKRSWRYLK